MHLAIIITANGGPYDERRAIETGADAFLAKPFSPRRLCELVDALAVGGAPDSLMPSPTRRVILGDVARTVHVR